MAKKNLKIFLQKVAGYMICKIKDISTSERCFGNVSRSDLTYIKCLSALNINDWKSCKIALRQISAAEFSKWKKKVDEPMMSKGVKYGKVVHFKRNVNISRRNENLSLNYKIWLVRMKPFAQKTFVVQSVLCLRKQWKLFATLQTPIRC